MSVRAIARKWLGMVLAIALVLIVWLLWTTDTTSHRRPDAGRGHTHGGSATEEIVLEIPWGEGRGELGFRPGKPNSPEIFPGAFVPARGGGWWIADSVNRALKHFQADGRVDRVIDYPGAESRQRGMWPGSPLGISEGEKGRLYVTASSGLAAMEPDGKIEWALVLPSRITAGQASHVAPAAPAIHRGGYVEEMALDSVLPERWQRAGVDDVRVHRPWSIGLASDGSVLVRCLFEARVGAAGGSRVLRFSESGEFIGTVPSVHCDEDGVYYLFDSNPAWDDQWQNTVERWQPDDQTWLEPLKVQTRPPGNYRVTRFSRWLVGPDGRVVSVTSVVKQDGTDAQVAVWYAPSQEGRLDGIYSCEIMASGMSLHIDEDGSLWTWTKTIGDDGPNCVQIRRYTPALSAVTPCSTASSSTEVQHEDARRDRARAGRTDNHDRRPRAG